MIADDFHKTDAYSKAYTSDSIMTFTGLMVRPMHLTSEMLSIYDIAHALGNICRYNGHVRDFYSVAQHCVLVSHVVPEHLALAGLLHDAAEAYFSDLVRPVKHTDALNEYRIKEDIAKILIWNTFLKKPPVTLDDLDAISLADMQLLRTEQRDLMAWHNSYPEHELEMIIEPKSSKYAEALFLNRWEELNAYRK